MSQFNRMFERIRNILYEPLAKIISSYTKILKELMKVFVNINNYISRYYFPRTFTPSMGITAPIESMGEEFIEQFPRTYVQPRISYTINLLRRVLPSRQVAVPQKILKSVEMPESLAEAYKIVGESVSYLIQAERKAAQYTLEKPAAREIVGIEHVMPKEFREKPSALEETILQTAPAAPTVTEAEALEKPPLPSAEALKVKEKPSQAPETLIQVRQELGEPFKYIGNLMNILAQVYSQLPETKYFIPAQLILPEEVYTQYYAAGPIKEIGGPFEATDYRFIQSLSQKTFIELGALEEKILPLIKEKAAYPIQAYRDLLSIPYIISYLILSRQMSTVYDIPRKAFYSLQQIQQTTYPILHEGMRLEAFKSAFTVTPITEYTRLLAREHLIYGIRLPTEAYSRTFPYVGIGPIAKAYEQTLPPYPRVHEALKIEDFARKAVFSKILDILETVPTLAQETVALKYSALETYYPLSTFSKHFLQNLIQLYDRLLYEVKIVRPSEPSPMITASSQFLETARIFRMAEEEARRETLQPTIRQPYTIQPVHPSQSIMEREIQNIFNITVPEGAELDLWDLERKITQILREQFRRYYGPVF